MLKKSQCFVIGGCLFVCCRERFVLFTRWGRWTRKQNFRPMEENRRHECQVSEEVGREKTQIWRREWPGAGSRGRNWERMMTSVGFSADPSWKRSLVQEIGLKRRFYSHSGMMWSTNQEKAGSLACPAHSPERSRESWFQMFYSIASSLGPLRARSNCCCSSWVKFTATSVSVTSYRTSSSSGWAAIPPLPTMARDRQPSLSNVSVITRFE